MNMYGFVDCCGNYILKKEALAIFVKSLMLGENIRNKETMRANTIQGYVKEINELHSLRGLPAPICKTKADPVWRLISNLQKEEDIARRREPVTKQMAAKLIKNGRGENFLSKEALIADITVINREMGCRAAELVQTKVGKPDTHRYPSGKTVIKSICRSWVKCYDKYDKLIRDPVKDRKRVHSICLTWLIQKNRRNGEKCWYTKNEKNSVLCVIEAIINIFERAEMLEQSDDLPMCVYSDKEKMKYLTRENLSKAVKLAAKEAHPHLTEDELKRFSCHSFRVWAAVLLSEQGKEGDYVKIRLRWVSEAYRVYLRNTKQSAVNHNDALDFDTEEINFEMLNLPNIVGYNADELNENEVGEYADETDLE